MTWSKPPATVLAARSPNEIRVASLVCGALGLMIISNLGRIPILSTGERAVPILVNDLVLGSLVIAGFLAMAAHRSLVVDSVAGLALMFAGIGALSAISGIQRFGLAPLDVALSLAYLARWLFYFAAYVVVINTVRARDVDAVWRAMETAVLVFAGFGVVQAAFLPDFALTVYADARRYVDWDPQGHRLVSTVLDPNFAGGFIVIGLLVSLARLAAGARVASWKLVLLALALVLTVSRSSVLAFLVGGLTILLIRGISKRMLRAIGAGALLILITLPKIIQFASSYNKFQLDASALTRFVSWAHGLRVLADHPIIGIGINTWGFVQEHYGWPRAAQSTYSIDGGVLFIAVMTGFVGLTVYFAMLCAVYRRARRVWRDAQLSANHRGIAIGAVAVIPALVVHSLFINSLMFPLIMESLWVVWALVACVDAARAAALQPDRQSQWPAGPSVVSLANAR